MHIRFTFYLAPVTRKVVATQRVLMNVACEKPDAQESIYICV